MFKKILIANRGEIACRVIRSARSMGIKTVAIYSDADKDALHTSLADEAVQIGPAPVNQSYIVIERVIEAIRSTGAEAVHPGYGFLSENMKFADSLEAEGVAFIGPPAEAIQAMGDKIASKKIAAESGVSIVPGFMGEIGSESEALKISKQIGFPVMIKASAGGGGKGMRIAWNESEVAEGFRSSKSEAASSFGDDRILIEKFITAPRHIEIQVLADKFGNCLYLNERECSIQRRNQKVIEEAPSPFLDQATREAMGQQAVALAKAVNYCSAGTVEFIVDQHKQFYFLEMNTRLQVEHPVTELTTGVDLVEQMIRIAHGERLDISQDDVGINGWAMESRIYAEDPYRNFLPSTGRLTRYRPPEEFNDGSRAIRNDTGVYEGGEISVYYDPMIAKLCTWASDRDSAIEMMRTALDSFELEGISCNIPFLSAVMDHRTFVNGTMTTAFIDEEFEDGFSGADLPEDTLICIAMCAAVMFSTSEHRNAGISGGLANQSRTIGNSWVVNLANIKFSVALTRLDESYEVSIDNRWRFFVKSDWLPGQTLAYFTIGSSRLVLKVATTTGGFRIRYRGADLNVFVRTPLQAALSKHMLVKSPPDTSKKLLCPMPGLLVSLAVSEGDKIEAGEALCTIEAMKMENVLKAERKGKVRSILASPGDTLSVDETIMEFE